MNKHAAIPAPTDPWERTKRTLLAVATAALVVLGAIPMIIQIIVDELGGHLPDGLTTWLLGAAVVVTAVTTAITRIMAIPRVNAFLSRRTPFGTVKPAEARELDR